MDKKEVEKRIGILRKEINKHSYLYHVLDEPEISDAIFDSLKNELEELENKFPELITPDSPSQRVSGKPLDKFEKVQHSTPMLSFHDAFSEEEMIDWEKRYEKFLDEKEVDELKNQNRYYCELKIDGLAIELVYKNGILMIGSTRGDGKIGENVTQNLKTISSIPLRILDKKDVINNLKKEGLLEIAKNLEKKFPEEIIVRGEVFINRKDFEKINKEQEAKGERLFANPRNVAAGSIRQLDSKITAKRKLDSFAYSLETDFGQKTHYEEHIILKSLGLKTNSHNKPAKKLEDVFEIHKYWGKNKDKLAYEIDGIVVILNSEKNLEKAGVAGKAPRAAIAYKFSAEESVTKVLDIILQIGRTGALTPVAILEPVKIRGATITRSTLHNFDEINRLGIKIGDSVVVSRAGDVIPKIIQALPQLRSGDEKNFNPPKYCPHCQTEVVSDKSGVILRCPNKKCFARQKEAFYHFVSKSGFNIDGLGPKIIDKLLDANLINDTADLFNIEVGDLESLEGMGEKSAQNIVSAISNKKEISTPRFLFSLGIPQVGEETAIDLTRELFSSAKKPSDLIKKMTEMTEEELEKITDIGPKTASFIYNWFKDKNHIDLIHKFDGVGIIFKNGAITKKMLDKKTIVITGTLQTMSRDIAKEKIRNLGGNISSTISKNTDFLLAGENPGSKFDKARNLGVKIISEDDFLKNNF